MSAKERGIAAAPAGRPAAAPQTEAAEDEPLRLIGEALELYILVQKGGELIIIDKHAAHERMIFDRISRDGAGVMSQALLESVPLTPPRDLAEVIGENLALFSELGFELESYGEGPSSCAAHPASWTPARPPPRWRRSPTGWPAPAA